MLVLAHQGLCWTIWRRQACFNALAIVRKFFTWAPLKFQPLLQNCCALLNLYLWTCLWTCTCACAMCTSTNISCAPLQGLTSTLALEQHLSLISLVHCCLVWCLLATALTSKFRCALALAQCPLEITCALHTHSVFLLAICTCTCTMQMLIKKSLVYGTLVDCLLATVLTSKFWCALALAHVL